MSVPALLLAYGSPLVAVDAADFDSTNDYLTRGAGLTGAADSKRGILSTWIRVDGSDLLTQTILAATGDAVLFTKGFTGFALSIEDTAGVQALAISTVGAYPAGSSWRHVLASWDVATASAHLYVDDVSDKAVSVNLNQTLDYTVADWHVGSVPAAPGADLDACLAEFYFAPGQYLDFSLVANRRKFISAGRQPINLGSTGALPTGTAPLIYLHLADGEAAANFATNRGTGGNFSVVGALTTCSNSPTEPSNNPVSMTGTSTASFIGNPQSNAALSSTGISSASLNTGPIATGVLSSTGAGAANLVGQGGGAARLTSAGTGAATFAGLAAVTGTAVVAPAGAATAVFRASSAARSALDSDGTGAAAFAGGSRRSAALSGVGTGAATFDGVALLNVDSAAYVSSEGDRVFSTAFVGTDSKMMTVSAWGYATGTGAGGQIFSFDNGGPTVGLGMGTSFGIQFLNSGVSAVRLDLRTSDAYANDNWWHFLCSFDMADPNKRHIYVTNVSDLIVDVFTDDTLDLSANNWHFGGNPGTLGGSFDGYLAELYINIGEYIDLSVEANRRKFISANGKPVYLGPDGSLPTGTAPFIYLHLGAGEAAANFATNRGSGPTLSVGGALATGASSPSD